MTFGVAFVQAIAATLGLLGTRIDATTPPPAATLQDQNGKPFTLGALHGKEVVLFFGYAHCRDVCPATMAKIARAYRALGPAAQHVAVAFVTVDRAHDTPAALRRYVGVFDKRFYGVTGSADALGKVYGAYHVWYQPLPAHGAGDDEIAHASSVYILDRDGHLRDVLEWTAAEDTIAHDMRELAPS